MGFVSICMSTMWDTNMTYFAIVKYENWLTLDMRTVSGDHMYADHVGISYWLFLLP
jgi:hypothetical protein